MAKIYGRESAAKRNKGKVYKAGTGFTQKKKKEETYSYKADRGNTSDSGADERRRKAAAKYDSTKAINNAVDAIIKAGGIDTKAADYKKNVNKGMAMSRLADTSIDAHNFVNKDDADMVYYLYGSGRKKEAQMFENALIREGSRTVDNFNYDIEKEKNSLKEQNKELDSLDKKARAAIPASSADIYQAQHVKALEKVVQDLNNSTVKDDKWQARYDNAFKALENAKAEEEKINAAHNEINAIKDAKDNIRRTETTLNDIKKEVLLDAKVNRSIEYGQYDTKNISKDNKIEEALKDGGGQASERFAAIGSVSPDTEKEIKAIFGDDTVYDIIHGYDRDKKAMLALLAASDLNIHNPIKTEMFLTQDERNKLNYLYSQGKADEANKLYSNVYKRNANARYNEFMQEYRKLGMEKAEENGGGGYAKTYANVAQFGENIAGGFAMVGSTVGQAISNAATGEYRDVDLNNAAGRIMASANTNTQFATKDMNEAGKFMYSTVNSILQNALFALTGPAALPLMGAVAAGQEMYATGQAGGTVEQMLIKGAAAGTIEMLTEKLPLDNLLKAAKGGIKGAKAFAKNIFKQAGIEATEEMVSEAANTIVDIGVMGGKSEYMRYIEEMKAQGATQREAENAAVIQFFLINPAQSGLSGAISGGVMGGGAGTIGEINRSINYNRLGAAYNEVNKIKSFTEYGLKYSEDTAIYKSAKKVADKLSAGKTVTNKDAADMVSAAQDLQRLANDKNINTPMLDNMLSTAYVDALKGKEVHYTHALMPQTVKDRNGNTYTTLQPVKANLLKYYDSVEKVSGKQVFVERMADNIEGFINGNKIVLNSNMVGTKAQARWVEDVILEEAAISQQGVENSIGLSNNNSINSEYGGIAYEGENTLYQDGRGYNSESTRESAGRLAETQRGFEERRRFSDSIGYEQNYERVTVSGSSGGKRTAITINRINSDTLPSTLKQITDNNNKDGLKTVFYYGEADVNVAGIRNIKADAFIQGDTMYIQADAANPLGTARHEQFHHKYATNAPATNRFMRKLLNAMTGAELKSLISRYSRAYPQLTSEVDLFQEIAADIYAGKEHILALDAEAEAVAELENAKEASSGRKREFADSMLKEHAAEILENKYGIGVDTETDSATFFSAQFIPKNTDEINEAARRLNEALSLDDFDRAREWVRQEVSIASTILDPKFSKYLDYRGTGEHSAIQANSDYPQGTLDFSNICRKRREYTEMVERLLEKYPNHSFSAEDLAQIRNIMIEEGLEVACGICYVEDRRQHTTEVASEYIKALTAKRKGETPKLNKNQQKVFDSLAEGEKYTPTIYDLTTKTGLEALRNNHRSLYDSWTKYNNGRGQQAERLLQGEAEYDRQILNYSEEAVEKINAAGGLRIYSFSDFEEFHLIDVVQAIQDCAAMGIKIQGYTKVPSFARLILNTGAKLNLSLIPKGKNGYHYENGKIVLDFDNVEGINTEDKNFKYVIDQNSANVGTIVIGINDTQIRAAMVDDNINYIIPFHSNQKGDILVKKGLEGWDNYKYKQSETDKKTGKKSKKQINIYTDVLARAEQEGKPITNANEFVDMFLKVCDENNLIPRFADFLNKDAQGNYVNNEGYYKLLLDFKLFDAKTLKILPHNTVVPEFDSDFITETLKNYVAEQKEKAVIDAPKIEKAQQRIENEIIGNGGEVRFSATGRGNGYDGYSMSNNARNAYDSGEMPISKWTKSEIINAVHNIDPTKAELIRKIPLAVLRQKILRQTSWHHTSSMYNRTDFYSVDEDRVRSLSKNIVDTWDTTKKNVESTIERGNFEYIEWIGTRKRLRANKHTLKDVAVEKKGSFYIVKDEDGSEIVRKKIGSNGTYFYSYAAEERAAEQAREAETARIRESTEEANKLYSEWKGKMSYSSSGHIYQVGRKPGRWDYNEGLDKFFNVGEKRLVPQGKGYYVETWNGTEWEQMDSEDVRFSAVDGGKAENELVTKLKKSIEKLSTEDTVITLNGNEFPKSKMKLSEQVAIFFKNLGNKITRKGFGDVILNENGIKSSIAHGIGRAKSIAFAAVPDVIAKGKQIDFQQNWKNRGYDSYVFAAPIKIGNDTDYVGVIVLKDNNSNRFYLHEVLDKDGNIILTNKIQPSHDFQGGTTKESPGTIVSNTKIAQPYTTVNNNNLQTYEYSENDVTDGTEEQEANVLTDVPAERKQTARERAAAAWNFFRRKIIDSGATVDDIGQAVNDPQLYADYNFARHIRGMGNAMIGGKWIDSRQHGGQYDFNFNKVGKSLDEIFRPVRDKGDAYTRAFFTYLLHEHNIDRMKQGKPVFSKNVTPTRSRNIADALLKRYPEFAKMAEEVWKFNDNNLQYRVDAGLISQEAADNMRRMYPHYVPTFREQPTMKGGGNRDGKVKINTGIKTATGGNSNILPIDEMMARQTMQMTSAAAQNVFGNRLLDIVLKNTKGMGKYIESVDKTGDLLDIDAEPAKTLRNTFVVYKNGVPYTMKVSDGVFEGLQAIAPQSGESNVIANVFAKVNDAYKRAITTYNPLFLLTNALKDIQDGALYSTNTAGMLKRYPKAFKEISTNGEIFQKYLAAGGIDSSFFENANNFRTSRNKVASLTVDKLEFGNIVIEQAPRLAEFITVYEKCKKAGMPEREAVSTAMYAADDITTNFGRSGTWGRVLNRTAVPFFNPGVQGFDKLSRTLFTAKSGKAWAGLAIKAAALGVLPAILNAALYKDDEDYEHLDQYIKDNYYLFKLPNGKFLRIPKGRVLSLFGSATSRFIKWLDGDENAWDGFVQNAANQVAPVNPITNNIFSAFTQISSNKAWHGGEIENQQMRSIKDPAMRYDETTSEIGKALGKALGMSPVQIDYLIDQYTGVFGDILLPLTSTAAEKNFVEAKFISDPAYSSDYNDEFYRMRDEVEKQAQAEKREANGKEFISTASLTQRYLNTVSDRVNELYNEADKLQADEYLDNKTKLDGVRELRLKINEVYDEAIKKMSELQSAVENRLPYTDVPEKEIDNTKNVIYANALNEVFGADTAMSSYGKKAYEKAIGVVNGGGITMDEYFRYYTEFKDPKYEETNSVDKKRALLEMAEGSESIVPMYAAMFETKDTHEDKSIKYAVDNGVSADTFVNFKAQDFNSPDYIETEKGTKAQQQKEWIFENAKSDDEIKTLYEMTFESENTKERSLMAYAKSQGVSPSAFIEREIQKSSEESESAGTEEDYIYENGRIVVDDKGQAVSGSKKAKACNNLVSSGYTDEEKIYFYQKEYSTDDKFSLDMAAGISPDVYIKYQADKINLVGEKDENGKTVSGSVKEAYKEYIYNLDIPEIQKSILFAQKYKVNGKEAQALRDYVASLNVDDKTKEAILETMQFGGTSSAKSSTKNKTSSSKMIDTSIFDVSSKKTYKPEAIKASKYLKAFTTKTKNMNTLKIEDVVKAMLNNPYYTAEMKKNARKLAKK